MGPDTFQVLRSRAWLLAAVSDSTDRSFKVFSIRFAVFSIKTMHIFVFVFVFFAHLSLDLFLPKYLMVFIATVNGIFNCIFHLLVAGV